MQLYEKLIVRKKVLILLSQSSIIRAAFVKRIKQVYEIARLITRYI